MEHLILLHGALGHPNYFSFITKALSTRFHVHALTFNGHAQSPMPDEDLSIEYYLKQLTEYCNEQGLKKVAFFGYSMGGYIALLFAAQFPDRVTSVMTLATKLNWSEAIAEQEAAMLEPETIKIKVPKFAAYLSSMHGEENWKLLTLKTAKLLQQLGRKPILTPQLLGQVRVPVQLMVGDKDNMVSIAETMEASKQINQANLAVLPATVHPFEKVNEALLLQLMKDFFKEN